MAGTSSKRRRDGTPEASDGSDMEQQTVKKSKGSKKESDGSNVDSNGDQYWELSQLRRATISDYRGKTMISIREYYEKDGQALPGKKGISMPIEQFSTLVSILPQIEGALHQKGQNIPRPDYSGSSTSVKSEESATSNEADVKANYEATSDED